MIYFDNSRNMKMESTYPPDLTRAAAAFAALGSEQRLTVLRALVRAGPEGLSIGELGNRTQVSGSTLTHHMKILAASGLVEQSRQGRQIICIAAAYDEVQALSEYLLTECCADAGSACEEHDHG